MKAITVQQPFATLIMTGLKQYEYRTWGTNYRGPLAIHAAARGPYLIEALQKHYDYFAHHRFQPADFPHGVILGSVQLVDCIPPTWWLHNIDSVSKPFVHTAKHFAWQLDEPEWLDKPVPAVGTQALWEAPDSLFFQTDFVHSV